MRSPVPAFALALAIGCSGDTSTASEAPIDFSITRVFSIETTGTDARDVVPGASGGYWVLTDHEPFLSELDSAGRIVRSFAMRGRGPTDLLAPWSLAIEPGGGEAWVYDAGKHLLMGVSSLARFPRAVPLRTVSGPVRADFRRVSYGDIATVLRDGDRVVAAYYSGEGSVSRHLLTPLIIVYDTSGLAVDTLLDFRASPPDTIGLGAALDLVPIPLWAGCGEGRVYVFDGYSGDLIEFSRSGVRRDVQLAGAGTLRPTPTRDEDIQRYVIGQLRHEYGKAADTMDLPAFARAVVRADRSRFSPLLPAASRLRCGPEETLLLQRFDLADDPVGYASEWVSIDPATGTTRPLRLPAGFEPRFPLGERIVGILRDEDGVATIAIAAAANDPAE